MQKNQSVIPSERIEHSILLLRGQKVMLDSDLALLYGVETKRLLEAVKRNIERFPEDFMFQLSQEEYGILRSQIATSKRRGGRRYAPYVFTEQGVAMLSGRSGKYRDYACFRAASPDAVVTCRSDAEGRSVGKEIRWTIQDCV